jgi:hypothetical protein
VNRGAGLSWSSLRLKLMSFPAPKSSHFFCIRFSNDASGLDASFAPIVRLRKSSRTYAGHRDIVRQYSAQPIL